MPCASKLQFGSSTKFGSKYDQGHTVFMAQRIMYAEIDRHGHNYGIYFTVVGVATLPIPRIASR